MLLKWNNNNNSYNVFPKQFRIWHFAKVTSQVILSLHVSFSTTIRRVLSTSSSFQNKIESEKIHTIVDKFKSAVGSVKYAFVREQKRLLP